ncbi:MAG: enoyl-CoA hydratase/isomerase family protein [Myxococcota bacterium]|nr:enoyl-CoA hydratase/isomerase family protein [Myxococcota bacterium]
MSFEFLQVEKRSHVALCTLSNPPRHTLVSPEVAELQRFLDEVEADREIRVVVFRGAQDGVFIAHYEVGELAVASERASGATNADPETPESPPAELHAMHRLCLRLEALDAISVAAINGNAAGGGCELSLACDFRLMMDGPHRIGLPETSVGIIPGAGGTQRLPRLLGSARALDLILHARLLTPAEALELGLVHRVFPSEVFHAEVQAFADDLASRAPIALAAAKRAIHQGAGLPLPAALALEQEEFERSMRSRDAACAMRAFVEGRTEGFVWKGE